MRGRIGMRNSNVGMYTSPAHGQKKVFQSTGRIKTGHHHIVNPTNGRRSKVTSRKLESISRLDAQRGPIVGGGEANESAIAMSTQQL